MDFGRWLRDIWCFRFSVSFMCCNVPLSTPFLIIKYEIYSYLSINVDNLQFTMGE